MTVWKNGVLLLIVVVLLLVVLHLHGHLLLDLLDQHSCCCSKYDMTVWQDGKLSAMLKVIFSTKTVPRGQNKCASGDKSGGRMGQMWVEGAPLESRIFVAAVHATKQLYSLKYEIPNTKSQIWNTQYQNIFLKKKNGCCCGQGALVVVNVQKGFISLFLLPGVLVTIWMSEHPTPCSRWEINKKK